MFNSQIKQGGLVT